MPSLSNARKVSLSTPLEWCPASVRRSSCGACPVLARAPTESSTAAHDEQTEVSYASLSPIYGAHFFNNAPKRSGVGITLYRGRARDERRRPNMGEEIVDGIGIGGRQGET